MWKNERVHTQWKQNRIRKEKQHEPMRETLGALNQPQFLISALKQREKESPVSKAVRSLRTRTNTQKVRGQLEAGTKRDQC